MEGYRTEGPFEFLNIMQVKEKGFVEINTYKKDFLHRFFQS